MLSEGRFQKIGADVQKQLAAVCSSLLSDVNWNPLTGALAEFAARVEARTGVFSAIPGGANADAAEESESEEESDEAGRFDDVDPDDQ